jgi:hypothetical protein
MFLVNCSGDQENASSHFTPGWNQTRFFLDVIGLWIHSLCFWGQIRQSGKNESFWQKNGNLAKKWQPGKVNVGINI